MKIALNVDSFNVIYKNNNLFFLLILIVVSLSIRLYYLPFEIPITFDGIDYFSFAFEVSKTQKFPTGILHTNDGWPLFLSPIFSIIGNSDFMSLVHAQRITSIVISTLTIIPVYILTRKFVSSKYALIGAGIFVFDPKLIEDTATYSHPTLPSRGIKHVLVNGTFVVKDGDIQDGLFPGKGIRGRG